MLSPRTAPDARWDSPTGTLVLSATHCQGGTSSQPVPLGACEVLSAKRRVRERDFHLSSPHVEVGRSSREITTRMPRVRPVSVRVMCKSRERHMPLPAWNVRAPVGAERAQWRRTPTPEVTQFAGVPGGGTLAPDDPRTASDTGGPHVMVIVLPSGEITPCPGPLSQVIDLVPSGLTTVFPPAGYWNVIRPSCVTSYSKVTVKFIYAPLALGGGVAFALRLRITPWADPVPFPLNV